MPSFVAIAAAALVGLAVAQNNTTSSGNTVNLFINDGLHGRAEYAASIVSACGDQTVYAIRCTSANVPAETCGPNAPILTLTEGPSDYIISVVSKTKTAGHSATVTLGESCVLDGTTAASCSGEFTFIVDKTTSSVAVSTVLTGTDYHRFDVAITGGAEKTASATGECKANAAPAGTSVRMVAGLGAVLAVGLAGVLSL
ncbi:hypothetical protein QBC33DRAFT_460630 [Phialemonium atrogriseum]|uniref:Uncharacterized protein n=1 Tax=Phialemonium atrogriseum TaxID=1093897 RepID=A0AAJ0FI24_9PEZI|nr:uncharacterized protein QBC33DRAFT_460630 [Phialemonium atrogriseum]KAK1762839.1 hypothetical protein QBC33DRAFT_460630 [Phialemonium atrogriseum]